METKLDTSGDELATAYAAVDIVVAYLVRRGYGPADSLQLAMKWVAEVYSRGERRRLALANFAIALVEREQRAPNRSVNFRFGAC